MKQKDLLNIIYNRKQLYKFVAGKGKKLLGLQIQDLRPATKQDWIDYVEEQNLVDNFANVLIANSKLKMFDQYRELIDCLDKQKDIIPWCKKLIISNQWKGYKNELIAQEFFQKQGFEVFNTAYKDDVFNSIDFQVIKDKQIGAVSVKSAGFKYNKNHLMPWNKIKSTLYTKLSKLYKTGKYRRIYLVVVKDDGQVIIHKTWPSTT